MVGDLEFLRGYNIRRRSSSVEDLQCRANLLLGIHLIQRDNVLVQFRVRKAIHVRVLLYRGPKTLLDFIHENNQLEMLRDRERPHSSTPYEDVSEASPRTIVPF